MAQLIQLRFVAATDVPCQWAAWVEAATGYHVERTQHVAFRDRWLDSKFGLDAKQKKGNKNRYVHPILMGTL